MDIVIIEDEKEAAWDLQHSIEMLRTDFKIIAIIDSVEAGVEWFKNNQQPDIIFSDIQLGDGLAFDILQQFQLTCPVIFCTAYDEYAIRAFQNNGIDYLLKPIKDDLLKKSLEKISLFQKSSANIYNNDLFNHLLKEISANNQSYKSTFLVSYREKIIPVNVGNILFFCIAGDATEINTNNNQNYRLNYSLDYIESIVDPKVFYRVNRQFLISHAAIKEVENYFERKLLIKLVSSNGEPVIVSKAKASEFLKWLERH